MRAFVRNKFCGRLAPEHFAGATVKAQDDKLVGGVRVCDVKDSLWLILRPGQARIYFAGVDRREDEKLVAPDNRGGTAVTLDRRLPLDVVGWAPLDGRLGRGGDSVGIRSAPVMPVVRLGLLKLIRMRLAMEKRCRDQGKRCDRGAFGFVQCHFRHLIAFKSVISI